MLPGFHLSPLDPDSDDEHSENSSDSEPGPGRLVRLRFLEAMHTPIPPFWEALLDKNCLLAGDAPCVLAGIRWQRFRCRLAFQELATNWDGWHVEGQYKGPGETVLAWHNTHVRSLLQGHENAPGSAGIFNDQCLRHGPSTHSGCSGVNFYADGGLETFTNHDHWIRMELHVCKGQKLRGGRSARYCIVGPGGEPCEWVRIIAIWFQYDTLPEVMQLT